ASTLLTKDDRFCEATAIILERQFADYLEDTGLSDPQNRSNLALTTCEGRDWLAWTLEKPLPAGDDEGNVVTRTIGTSGETNCDIGYMLGEFIQYLLDTKKKVSLKHMWENYSNSLGFHGMLIDFFGFKTDNEFTIAYEKFCKKYMKEIVADQVKDNNGAYKRGLLDKPRAFNPRYSVQRIENICMNVNGHGMFTNYKAWAYGAKVFQFRPSQNEAKLRYNAFIVPSKSISQGMLKTVVLDSKYKYNESSCFFAEIKTARNDANVVPTNVVLFYRPAISGVDITDDWWVDVVAMYEPTQKVSVRGANDSKECISVMPNARPMGRILEKHYVTGMQILCKNNKTGRKSQISIIVDDCGSAVEFPYQQLGLTKDGDIDVSFASRWYYLCEGEETLYYSPATEWVDYKRKGKEQKKEEPKPKEEEKVVPVQKSEPEPASNYSYSGSFEVFNHAGLCYDHPPVIGHVSVSGNSIKITIPAHKRTWSGGGLTSVYDASSIDVTFVGKVYYSEETKSYSIGFSDIKEIKMSSFSTKEVSDHPEDKYHSVHIEYYKEHELTKNRRIHVPTISGKELDLEFDVDCRFTWETDKDGKHTSTNDCKHNWKPYHGEWYTTWNHIQGKMQ
ncbi:MAG: hypothetical protein IK092_00600, partial [Muribaculaceae bacterium]|nr:hypothetical protein [Muribaculaceae bacterium]